MEKNFRDYTHVDDVVKIIDKLRIKKLRKNLIYSIFVQVNQSIFINYQFLFQKISIRNLI